MPEAMWTGSRCCLECTNRGGAGQGTARGRIAGQLGAALCEAAIMQPSPPRTRLPSSMIPQHPFPITGRTLSRADVQSLLSSTDGALTFVQCDFDDADLTRLDLRGASFIECSFVEAALSRALLADSRWRQCKGRQADFELADLTDAQFERCDLNNTQWRRARLASARFSNVKLTGARLADVAGLGLVFEESLLISTDLRGLSFRKQRLVQLDLSDADLTGCDFTDAVFDGGSLRNANLTKTRFAGADLRQVDLGGLKLPDTSVLKGATISYHQAAELLAELGLHVA